MKRWQQATEEEQLKLIYRQNVPNEVNILSADKRRT